MKIGGKPYRTIWPDAEGTSFSVIDQTILPFRFETRRLVTLEEEGELRARDGVRVVGASEPLSALEGGVAVRLRVDGDTVWGVAHRQDEIDARKRARTMGDDDDDAGPLANARYRTRQCHLAVDIQVGIRLVEHDEEGIAVERAGKRDALTLAGGEHGTIRPYFGLIAFGEPQDEIVNAGIARCRDNFLCLRIPAKTRNVLRDGAVHELRVLQHETDARVEFIGGQRSNILSPNAYRALTDVVEAGQQRGQGRLAGPRRAHERRDGAGPQRQRHVVDHRNPGAIAEADAIEHHRRRRVVVGRFPLSHGQVGLSHRAKAFAKLVEGALAG